MEKGKQIWEVMPKLGRPQFFDSPEDLWERAMGYFKWAIDNPWYRHEAIKSGDYAGSTMKVATARPFTLHGLCVYLGCTTSYFRTFKVEERVNKEAFLAVFDKLEEIIYQQKFEGAAVGAFKENLIARDLGLIDRKEVDNKGAIAINISKDEELLGE